MKLDTIDEDTKGKRPAHCIEEGDDRSSKKARTNNVIQKNELEVAQKVMEICIKRGLLGKITDASDTERIVQCYTALKKAVSEDSSVTMSDLYTFCGFVSSAAENGVIRVAEFQVVGALYSGIHKFIMENNDQ